MVSKCANPECSTPFQYFRDGKLFQVDRDEMELTSRATPPLAAGKRAHRVEHYWLCGACSATLTLTYDPVKGIATAALPHRFLRRAAAA
jgi:hypothetical protein